jgi:8-oxo-dGTP pyrophosphatase MutT (NUDIX family)
MYKIYINETPLYLLQSGAGLIEQLQAQGNVLISRYSGKIKTLPNYFDMLEKTRRYAAVVLFSDDFGNLEKDFFHCFQKVEAGGGVVVAPSGKVLFIHRLGHWDLPKGKIDPGEDPPTAALREVREETGIKTLRLGDPLPATYHTYKTASGKRMLKVTFWFKMYAEEQPLYPQAEEDITAAVWEFPETILSQGNIPVYRNIRDILDGDGSLARV